MVNTAGGIEIEHLENENIISNMSIRNYEKNDTNPFK